MDYDNDNCDIPVVVFCGNWGFGLDPCLYYNLMYCVVCLDNFKMSDKCKLLSLCNNFLVQCVDSWFLKTPICLICIISLDFRKGVPLGGKGSCASNLFVLQENIPLLKPLIFIFIKCWIRGSYKCIFRFTIKLEFMQLKTWFLKNLYQNHFLKIQY